MPVRVDDETKERWAEAASRAGLSLSEYVRGAVNDQLDGAPPLVTGREVARRKRSSPGKAAKECERARFHRPGSFCKGCDTVPA